MMQAAAMASSCSPQLGAGVMVGAAVNVPQKCGPLRQRVTIQRPRSGLLSLRAKAQENDRPLELYVDYEGNTSVFPDEDCEETGENCNSEGIFKESKPKPATATAAPPEKEASGPDTDYEAYDGPKTVFQDEACDDLGGEFCEPENQEGAQPDKVGAKK